MRQIVPAMMVAVLLLSLAQSATAQEDLQKRVDQLGQRIDQLEAKKREPVTLFSQDAGGVVFLLFGAFCALWAQNTNRNPWLWFFLGVFFNFITVLVLLAKNADDRWQARGELAAGGSLVAVAIILGLVFLIAFVSIFWFKAG
jgi:hypothetical protein